MSRTRPGGGPLGRVYDWRPGPHQPYGPPRPGRRAVWTWPDQLAPKMLRLPPEDVYPKVHGEPALFYKQPPTILAFTDPATSAPYTDGSMPPTDQAGGVTVSQRAIWQSPVFDMHPRLQGAGGTVPGGFAIWHGQNLYVQISMRDADVIRALPSLMNVYSIMYTGAANAIQAGRANDRPQDITQEVFNGNDASALTFSWPSPARFWSVRLVFDLVAAEAPPRLLAEATVI